MEPIAFIVGRALFAAIFLIAAPRHFTGAAIAHASELGVPLANLAVPISGVLAIVGGLGTLIGYQPRISALCLIAFLVPVTFMMHAFWRIDDPVLMAVQRVNFVKNIALLGTAIMLAARPS